MKVLPADQIAAVEPKPFNSASHSIFISETDHVPVIASLPRGTKIGVGDSASVNVHTKDGRAFSDVLTELENPGKFSPAWSVTKGDDIVSVSQKTAPSLPSLPGDATVEAKIPGIAARSGFLFIKALGQVGFYADGAVNWDIAILVGGFGLTLFLIATVIRYGYAGKSPTSHRQQNHPGDDYGNVPVFPTTGWSVALHGDRQYFPSPTNVHSHERSLA